MGKNKDEGKRGNADNVQLNTVLDVSVCLASLCYLHS
jgi:hypothetical protein